MISKRTLKWTGRKVRTEVAFMRGLDDWRLGVYVERHPRETQIQIQVPCLAVNILRCW